MSKILEYTIYIILGLAFMLFIGYIEMLQTNLKKKKELEKRIGRAKMFILKKSCGELKLTWGNEILKILDGKDELGDEK